MDRRNFIKFGISSGISCSLGTSLLAQDVEEDKPYILTIHTDGGMDPTMVFDPKVVSPYYSKEDDFSIEILNGIRFGNKASRPAVMNFFETNGAKSLVVNGLNCQSIDHNSGYIHMTAHQDLQSNLTTDLVSYYAAQTGGTKGIPHLLIDCPFYPGAQRPFVLSSNHQCIEDLIQKSTPTKEAALTNYLTWKYSEWQQNTNNNSIDNSKKALLYQYHSKELLLQNSLASFKKNSSDSNLLLQSKLAIDLFKQGTTQCASLIHGNNRAWDTHQNHFALQDILYEDLFDTLGKIVAYATSQGMQDKIILIVKSEIGRQPKLNKDQGKGHWPYSSLLLWGAGIKGGSTIGRTDKYGRGEAIDPIFGEIDQNTTQSLTYSQIISALYQLAGVPTKPLMPRIIPASVILRAG